MKKQPVIGVTRFWMRTVRMPKLHGASTELEAVCRTLAAVEFLVEHDGRWIKVFGPGIGSYAVVDSQTIDDMIHPTGVQNLIDYGDVNGGNRVNQVRGRQVKKPDRRDGMDRRADRRRAGDKVKEILDANARRRS